MYTPKILNKIAESDELLEVARRAIEEESSVIRLGPEDALRIGLKAIAKRLESENKEVRL